MAESPQKSQRTLSAYACFTNHFIQQTQASGGQQSKLSTDLSKVASERWKGMTEDEKKPFKVLSIQNKAQARLQQESAQMGSLPPGAVVTSSTSGRKRKLPTRKGAKDPDAPKRPTTAFFFFCQVARPKVRAEHPEYKVTEVSKELGKLWGALKPEEKEKFNVLAARDRDRYRSDMLKYAGNQEGQGSESEADNSRN